MPDMRLREVHLPELHLPEMSRDDIVRAIGDATRDVDLSRFDPRRIELSESARTRLETTKADLSSIDLSKVDVPKAIATVTQAAGLVRLVRRPRLPFVIGGLVTLGLIGYALATSPVVRPRLDDVARKARARIDAMRTPADEEPIEELDVDVEVEAIAVPIEPSAFIEDATTEVAENADVIEATAEAATDATVETVIEESRV
jgi:hypothetical protein